MTPGAANITTGYNRSILSINSIVNLFMLLNNLRSFSVNDN